MKRVLCFGELLLRMSPMAQGHWLNHAYMPVYTGGAELNVARALTRWKIPATYLTALPDNYLSAEIVNYLSNNGVHTSLVPSGRGRIGLYFLPQGAGLKDGSVIYDREGSCFSQLRPGMIDWDAAFENINWFHFSAITPALGNNLVDVCMEAAQAAGRKKITVSVDLNYRQKLWQWGCQPVEVVPDLVKHCDVIMANIWSANALLGVDLDSQIHAKQSRQAYIDHAFLSGKEIMNMFPNCKVVANTFRFDEGGGVLYYATLQQPGVSIVSAELRSKKIVDKSGSGDCFMAGLIYGLLQKQAPQATLDFAAAAAFGKLHEKGDSTQQSFESVEQTLAQYV